MFCKWCGTPMRPTDGKCPACHREQPPASDCNGFYHLVPDAKILLESAKSGSVAETKPAAPVSEPAGQSQWQPPVPVRPRSPWPTVIAGAAVLALVVVTGLLIRSSAQVRRLEDRVQELEQQTVLLPTQTPQSTAGTGPATQPPTEAVTQPATEPATEPSMQPTTAPSTQPATDPVMTTAEIAGADLTFTMTIDGQRVTGGCAELGRQLDFEDNSENGAWIGEFALENDPQDTEAELRISLEQDSAQTTIRLSCNVDADGDNGGTFGQSGGIQAKDVIWTYDTGNGVAMALPQTVLAPEDSEAYLHRGVEFTLSHTRLKRLLGQGEELTLSFRCVRENVYGGSITFDVTGLTLSVPGTVTTGRP